LIQSLTREARHGRVSSLRWLKSFVAVQVAAAVVLTVGAGLLMRSLTNLLAVNPGFRPQQVVGFSISLPVRMYAEPSQMAAFWVRLRESLSRIPGVEAAGLGDLPLAVRETRSIYAGEASGLQRGTTPVRQSWVHGEYFRALGVPLAKGRWFTDQDSETSNQ
jgi:hypothetical protein